ncbi:MAG: hypothetical protein PVH32_10030, partial [Chromatiales bacterium]
QVDIQDVEEKGPGEEKARGQEEGHGKTQNRFWFLNSLGASHLTPCSRWSFPKVDFNTDLNTAPQ